MLIKNLDLEEAQRMSEEIENQPNSINSGLNNGTMNGSKSTVATNSPATPNSKSSSSKSVKKKLVSLTLKKRSKLTEEVSFF